MTFGRRATLWGPISDVVPSTPVYDMYPIGFAILSDYLERHGFRTRIVNLAVRMLRADSFDAEQFISRLRSRAFGIDLHWLPHAHGSLEVARLVRKHHPGVPILFGGFSATYYHEELIRYPQVDYVVRGDSTEEPLRQLMECLDQGQEPVDVPNLTWKDAAGQVHVNPTSYRPSDLDHIGSGFRQMVRSVIRDRDLVSYAPFARWLDYPVMVALTVRGCTQNCTICGGCAEGHTKMSGRSQPRLSRSRRPGTGRARRPPHQPGADLHPGRSAPGGQRVCAALSARRSGRPRPLYARVLSGPSPASMPRSWPPHCPT